MQQSDRTARKVTDSDNQRDFNNGFINMLNNKRMRTEDYATAIMQACEQRNKSRFTDVAITAQMRSGDKWALFSSTSRCQRNGNMIVVGTKTMNEVTAWLNIEDIESIYIS